MANLKTAEKKTKAQSMGMHTETLTGKTQQKFFNPDEAENFFYWGTYLSLIHISEPTRPY